MTIRSLMVLTAALLVACEGNEADSVQGLTGSAEVSASAAAPPVAGEGKVQGVMTDQVANPQAARRELQQDKSFTASSAPQTTAGAAADVSPSMLIRTGNASIEVSKLDPAVVKLRQLATQLGGYVANSSISGGRDQVRSATLELKIPAARYDQAVTGLGGIGKVESVNTSVEDVGEEYVDVSARVTNAKRLEERLVNILAARSARLSDVLAVERELARVREEIERYEGRLRFLRTRAAVSTLTVTVHEPFPLLGQHPGDNPIIGAIKQAWRNFVAFVSWSIAALGVLIPLGALVVGGWYAYRRIRTR